MGGATLKKDMFLGRQVAVYKITEFLGEGGFAFVYKARDQNLDIDVALKILKPAFAYDEVFEENFRKEAHRAAKFRHPNVIAIHYAGKDDDIVFFSMDLLPTGLKDMMKNGRPVEQKKIIEVGIDVASALEFAHTHEGGIVHRDLKPDNILFDRHGNAVVTDFGISEAATSYTAATGTTVYVGTPKYMSPEQARGQRVDQRSDIYSLGVTLYEMATGEAPFTGRDWFELGRKHIEEEAILPTRLNPGLNPELERMILKCLQKDPRHRYQRAENLKHDLMAVAAGGQASAQLPAQPAANEPPSRAASVPVPETLPGYRSGQRGFHEATTQPVSQRRSHGLTYVLLLLGLLAGGVIAYDMNVGGLQTMGEEMLPALANLPYVGSGKVYAASFLYSSAEGGAAVDQDFRVVFSGPVDPATATRDNVKILGPGDRQVPAEVTLMPSGTRLSIRPEGQLAYETSYRIVITAGLMSQSGEPVIQNPRATEPGAVHEFTTGRLPPDSDPPALTRTRPPSNAVNVPVDMAITLEFNEQMAPGTVNDRNVTLSDAEGNLIGVEVLLNSDFTTARVQPRGALRPDTRYSLNLAEAITDASGNHLPPSSFAFTTAGSSTGSADPSLPAKLNVRIQPARAMAMVRLELNGEDQGNIPKQDMTIPPNTPITLRLLAQPPYSQHTLLIHEQILEARPGQSINVNPSVRAFGVLTVAAEPAADVFVDGEFVGSTPLAGFPLFSGEHELELQPAADANNYRIYRTRFTLAPFERKRFGSIRLERR